MDNGHTISKHHYKPYWRAYKPCEFLDVDADGKYSCSIYPLRPAVCKDFAIKEWECPNNPEFYGKAPKNKRLKNKKVDSFFKRVFFRLFSGFFVSIMLITAISALILNALHLISDNLSGIISFATVGICSIIVIFLEKRAIRNTLVEN